MQRSCAIIKNYFPKIVCFFIPLFTAFSRLGALIFDEVQGAKN